MSGGESRTRILSDSPCGVDVGQPKTWVVELDGSRKAALETGRTRLIVAGLIFSLAFLMVGVRLVDLSVLSGDKAPRVAGVPSVAEEWRAARAPILDRNGVVLASTLPTMALYANPRQLRDPVEAADRLAEVVPDAISDGLRERLASDRSFVWVKRCLSPRETAEVNRLGIPGLHLQEDECRVYPHGSRFAHIVGFTDVDAHGIAGLESAYDESLRNGEPLELSLDVRVQHILTEELQGAIDRFSAIGGAGLVLDANSGEVLALSSLPSFDPRLPGRATPEQTFNRATLGVYEVGSVMKSFSTATALDSGAVALEDGWDTSKPIRVAGYTINDFHPESRWMSVPEIFQHSSNIGTVHMAMTAGTDTVRHYLDRFGMLTAGGLELPEKGAPLVPKPWREINTMTISYGHGLALTPVQVARGFASLVNGGELVQPTLIKTEPGSEQPRERVISERTSLIMRRLLRLVVEKGSGSRADAPGYLVGGKTGTADKLSPAGGYLKDKRIASFAGAFPIDDPRYVIFLMVDEPKPREDTYGYATAGWVAAPAVSQIVSRLGPLMGIQPTVKEEHPPFPPLIPATFEEKDVAAR